MSRENFEAWASDDGKYPLAVERSGDSYRLLATQNNWEVWQAATASMQAERDQLAAECAALKKSIPPLKMVNDFDDSWDDVSIAEEVGFNHAISTILRNFPETPATDRFLAEQRAVGVEMVAAYIKQSIQHLPEGDRLAYHDAIELCSGAAAQLRNEVNHG